MASEPMPRDSLKRLEAKGAILGFQGEYRWISNFWRAPGITAYGIPCPTTEHAFVIAKIPPDAPDRMQLAREIAAMERPGDAKKRGREIALREDWEQVKAEMMASLLARKFAPGTRLARQLAETGARPIVELNTWGDRTWGMILLADGDTLEGHNLMGRLLEARRRSLLG